MKKFLPLLAALSLSITPALAGNNGWEGVFTSAHQSGGIWTASVFDHARGHQLTKQFRECRAVVKPIRGFACRNEVLNFVFADGGAHDDGGAVTEEEDGTDWEGVFPKAREIGQGRWATNRPDTGEQLFFAECEAVHGGFRCHTRI
jgi:hypothetical protein